MSLQLHWNFKKFRLFPPLAFWTPITHSIFISVSKFLKFIFAFLCKYLRWNTLLYYCLYKCFLFFQAPHYSFKTLARHKAPQKVILAHCLLPFLTLALCLIPFAAFWCFLILLLVLTSLVSSHPQTWHCLLGWLPFL